MNADRHSAQPLISVLVVNYNGAALLPACLQSLRALTYPRYEVVVVDNASTDESMEVLRGADWIRVVRSERNLGFAGGNNLGFRHSHGEWVLLLNNDTVAPPELLTELWSYLSRHAEAGVVQGKMLLPRFGNRLDVCGSFLTPLGLPYHYGYYKPDGPRYDRSYAVFSGKGACLLFRREVVIAAGGFLFDEDFFCYYEESDFCHRAWLAGYETHFVPSKPVAHWMGATSARNPKAGFVLRQYLRNMTFSLCSNLSPASLARIMPLFLAVLFVGMLASAACLKWSQCLAHAEAMASLVTRMGKIRARRALVKSIRKRSDREIFAKILRNPGWSYFLKTFKGRLAAYEDRDLGS